MRRGLCSGLFALAVLANVWLPATASAQCPANTFQGNTNFVPGNLGFIHTKSNAAYAGTAPATRYIAMRWGCIIGSPSCDNPGLVFEPSHNWMMWRRHERASDCVWIPASRISMRSGSAGGRVAFEQITDPDTSVGGLGDIVVSPSTTELFQAWNDLDAAWTGTTKGVVALSADRLINSAGTSVARGIAVVGLITMPYLAMADSTNICQSNERSLAHELGHVLSLPHVGTAGNLMVTGGSATTDIQLSNAQHTQARNYLDANLAVLDPPLAVPAGFPDRTFDGLEQDLPAVQNYADIINSVVLDNGIIDDTVTFCAGTNGLVPRTFIDPDTQEERTDDMCVAFALDCDGNPLTGDNAALEIAGMNFQGAEFIAMLLINRETREVLPVLKAATGIGQFVSVQLEPGVFTAEQLIGDIVVCDPFPAFQGQLATPAFTEFRATLSTAIFQPVLAAAGIEPGPDGRTFPVGLRLQVATAEAEGMTIVDQGASDDPENGGVMLDFEDAPFPEITVRPRMRPGDQVDVSVTGMPPNQDVHILVGAFGAGAVPNARTDDQGEAQFQVDVPETATLGATLMTVGVDDPGSTITADAIIEITECPPDLDANDQLTIFDFLTFQNLWQAGNEVADYDGDGELTIFDFLSYQNDFQTSCP